MPRNSLTPAIVAGALAVSVLAACGGEGGSTPLAPQAPTTPSAASLAAVVVTPHTDSLDTNQTVQLAARGRSRAGDSMSVVVTWSVSGGTLDSAARFSAALDGEYAVVAKHTSGLADTAHITVKGKPHDPAPAGAECASPRAGWVWCDDFEKDRLASYYEYITDAGSFQRVGGVGKDGSYGMRAHFAAGQVSAGALHLALGRTPQAYFRPVDAGTANYRELYWRLYLKNQAGWVGGGGNKLTRATVFASSTSWAQAMIAHVWSGGASDNALILDPARGTDAAGNLVTTTYNDFANLTWLGQGPGVTPVFDAAHVGAWHCVEAHVRLNDAGQSNGVFEFWLDGGLEAQRTGLNFLGSYSAYGLNAVFFENYWNAGSPVAQERYMDNIVVSTQRIGC